VPAELAPPDHPDLAEAASTWRSVYLHLPFCARVCPYCDFAVVAGRDGLTDRYLAALESEVLAEPPWYELEAVFVGGGTPSRVPTAGLRRLLALLRGRFGLVEDAEVTLEANPEDWNAARASALVEAGFTRVSLGVQSFDRAVLTDLGRLHTPDQAVAAVSVARAAGFASVSLDLIYGSPAERHTSWERTLRTAVALGPDHISAYALTVEPGTELWRGIRSGKPGPDPDEQADRWEAARAILTEAGFVRYEVSNHARPGHVCRYNLSVWGRGEYLGFGLGAHGFRDGIRRRNVRRLDTYLERVESGIGPVQAAEVLSAWEVEQERLMLGLRRSAGVVAGPGGRRLLASPAGERLQAAGVIDCPGDRIVVTRPLLTDEVVRAVLATGPEPDESGPLLPWHHAGGAPE
jgi:putative oxygen-independent coproporphyrinogen III oxidase